MAITTTVDVLESELWPQGDIRDPLGLWGFRVAVTGDATGGSIKATVTIPVDRRAAYVYTAYSAIITVTSVTAAAAFSGKIRLLTNWPNVDPQPGVQAYGAAKHFELRGADIFTPPQEAPHEISLIGPLDRFLLLFDPRPAIPTTLNIMELELAENTLADTYSFEGYGYYWDRSVMQAPGGPRHPGSN